MEEGEHQERENRPKFETEGSREKKKKIMAQVALRPTTLGSLVGDLKWITANTITPDKAKKTSLTHAATGMQLQAPEDNSQNAKHTTQMASERINEWY